MKNIKTGVDKLVDIVSQKKKITIDDAAKQLGVGQDVVQEWAEFLEQEGLISINYRLSSVWLEEKKISKQDVISSAKAISSEKDAFMRKIDIVIKSLERETIGFEEVRKQFREIHGNIKNEIATVKLELAELERYETLKRNIDKEIESQIKYYDTEIGKYFDGLKKDEKQYEEVISEIEKEKKKILETENKLKTLLKSKDEIQKTISQAIIDLKENEKTLAEEAKKIYDSEKKISKVKAYTEKVVTEAKTNKEKAITSLLEKLEADKERTRKEQEDLLEKAKEKTREILKYHDAGKKIYESFKGFFIKKIKTEELINKIDKEKTDMVKELEDLKRKVAAFSLMTKNQDIKGEMKEIEAKIKKMESNKNSLMKKIESLVNYIKG